MKSIFLAVVLVGLVPTFASADTPKWMNQYDALEVCPVGTHVPSARELAQRAVTLGAKGIIESGPVSLPGYRFVAARNMDGSYDGFYFNGEGYQPPSEEEDFRTVWTSSVNQDARDGMGYPMDGDGIVFGNSKESGFGSVRRLYSSANVICFPGNATQPKEMILKQVWGMPGLDAADFSYCPAGTHMPTAREMAKIAMRYGAKGILEMDQVDPQKIPAGYSKVGDSTNYSCSVQKPFYFNGEGIQMPSEWKGLRFWTYSCHEGLTGYRIGHYKFDVVFGIGAIFPEYYSDGTHTLCLVGRPQ